MNEPRALVENASSGKQVREARKTERNVRDGQLEDLRVILGMPEGRRVLWRFMEKCGTFRSVFDGHGAKMSFNSGQQDVGHFIQAEIMEARRDAFAQMMDEDQQEKMKRG